MTQQAPEKTKNGNSFVKEVWVTHHDTVWGPYLGGASLYPWDEDYCAPITQYADKTRFINEALTIRRDDPKLLALVDALRMYACNCGEMCEWRGLCGDDARNAIEAWEQSK